MKGSVNEDKLFEEINRFKTLRDKQINPIQKEYQVYIDNCIFQELPFKIGDILKHELNGEIRYFIYKGVKSEKMFLLGCKEDGIRTSMKRNYSWTIYDEFEVHKEVDGE